MMNQLPVVVIVVPIGEEPRPVAVDTDELRFLQQIVGGHVEAARRAGPGGLDPVDAWIHETGLVDGLPLNVVASIVAGQPLAGYAVLAGHTPDGEMADCPEWAAEYAWAAWAMLDRAGTGAG